MIVALFRRRLKDGVTFEDFIAAWEADAGFSVPARVLNAVSVDDPCEILSVGFVDIDAATIATATETVADQEAVRHSRIEHLVESTILHAYYDLRTEHDFSGDPRAIDLASPESLLAAMKDA